LDIRSDTLEIVENCDPRTKEKHEVSFCLDCELSGLRPGSYYIKTIEEIKKITIF
jgi:hypothetical protein